MNEVGVGQGDSQRKANLTVPMAQLSRKGIKKEKGCTPVLLESHPMEQDGGSGVVTGGESKLWFTRGGGKWSRHWW